MVNDIAPLKEIPVEERIKEIGSFLGKEGKKAIEETKVDEPIPEAPTPPIYPTFSPTAANAEMINLLSQIVKNQETERKSWERNNPLITDSPVYDWAEATINPGFQVIFTLTIPEGSTFFFEYFNITYAVDSVYNITIDGAGTSVFPTLTDVLQDFGDHFPIFKPPRLCYRSVVITALNGGVVAQAYGCFIRGFYRQTIKTEKEYLGQQ